MRNIEIRTVEDIKVVFVDDENTGLDYTKKDINEMLDDLMTTSARSRNDLLTELITKSMARTYSSHPLEDGPLTPDELSEVIRVVGKSCKKGWFE